MTTQRRSREGLEGLYRRIVLGDRPPLVPDYESLEQPLPQPYHPTVGASDSQAPPLEDEGDAQLE